MATARPFPSTRRRVVSQADAEAIERRVAAAESRCGIEIVAAVIARADAYPELPWKAFALGASIAAAGVVVLEVLRPDWVTAAVALGCAVSILAVGAAAALATVFVPASGRWLLSDERAEGEVRQYADALFLARDLVDTPGRDAVLLLASRFEQHVVVVPDRGLGARVEASRWAGVVDAMRPALRQDRIGDAFECGLREIEALVASAAASEPAEAGRRFADRPIEEA